MGMMVCDAFLSLGRKYEKIPSQGFKLVDALGTHNHIFLGVMTHILRAYNLHVHAFGGPKVGI